MDLVEVGARFTEERERLGYTQAGFARLLNVTRVTLANAEAGKNEFKIGLLIAGASAGMDVQYVLTGVRSKNTEKVTDEIGFEKQVIKGNVSGIGFVGDGANVTINHNPRTTIKAETKPGEEHIDEPQKRILTDLVEKIVETEAILKKTPKTHRAVWASLNKHCGVTTYKLIKIEDFQKARKFLNMWLGRLNAAPSAPVKNGDAWRSDKIRFIKTNIKTPEDEEAVYGYMKRNFGATSLKDLAVDELIKTYQYTSGRRRRK